MKENINQSIAAISSQLARVAGYLWQKGWAERNAGNISVCLRELLHGPVPLDAEIRDYPLPEAFPGLAGQWFLVTATGSRMRDLARSAFDCCLVIRLNDSGTGYTLMLSGKNDNRKPTSELAAHLGIHAMIAARGSAQRAVLHTHATELIALTQLREFCEERNLNRVLWGMHPETKVFVPAGVGLVPYILPGTGEIAAATVKALETHEVAVWEKHGVFAIGTDPEAAFDLVDILAKSAAIYFLCRSAGQEPEGLSPEQLDELGKIVF